MLKTDLHMHTKYSDGVLTLSELLAKATETNLQQISITDHNNVEAYYEIAANDYSSIFAGKIIKGVEIYSYYCGKVIEFLVYDYNLDKMKQFLDQNYSKNWSTNRINYVLSSLKNVDRNKGMTFNESFTISNNVGECASFYKHLMQFPENRKFFSEEVLNGKKSFFRNDVCNPESDFYIDYSNFYVKPQIIIDFVKKTGGKIFLAHLFEYNLKDPLALLDDVKNWGISGNECYHPIFTKDECLMVLEYNKKNHLLGSGGSDFHGGSRPNKLGVLNENIVVDYSVFDWTKELNDMNKGK